MYACVGGAGAVATMSCYYPHDPLLFTPIDTGRIGPNTAQNVIMFLCAGRLPSLTPGEVRSRGSQNQIIAGIGLVFEVSRVGSALGIPR